MTGTPAGVASARVDSWLWATRIYRTRSLAAAACRAGHVRIGGERVKPSAQVHAGSVVRALAGGRERVLVVARVIVKRVGAPEAAECYRDDSPPEPRREDMAPAPASRDRGAGRPTKRERREIDRFRGRAR